MSNDKALSDSGRLSSNRPIPSTTSHSTVCAMLPPAYTRSKIPAAPMPVPMHIVTMP